MGVLPAWSVPGCAARCSAKQATSMGRRSVEIHGCCPRPQPWVPGAMSPCSQRGRRHMWAAQILDLRIITSRAWIMDPSCSGHQQASILSRYEIHHNWSRESVEPVSAVWREVDIISILLDNKWDSVSLSQVSNLCWSPNMSPTVLTVPKNRTPHE